MISTYTTAWVVLALIGSTLLAWWCHRAGYTEGHDDGLVQGRLDQLDNFTIQRTGSSADLKLSRLHDRIIHRHVPFDQEVELYCHDDTHAAYEGPEQRASFDRCGGHPVDVPVCAECGHDDDGDGPVFRPWPCPTLRMINELDLEQIDPPADPTVWTRSPVLVQETPNDHGSE